MKRFISFFLCLIFYGCLTLKPINPPTPTPPEPLKYRLFITFIKLYTPTEITEVPDEDRGFLPDKIISYTTMEKMYISNYEPNKKKASPDDDQFDVKVTDPSGNTVDGTTKTGKKWSTYVVDVEESSITTQGKNWVGDLIDKNTFNGFTVNQTYHIVLTFKYNKAETSIEIPVQRNDTGPDPDHWSSFVSFVKFTTPDKTLKAQDSSFDGTYQYDSMDTMYVSNHMSSSQIQTKKRSFFGLRSVRGVKTTDARTPDDDQFDMKVTDPSGNTVDGTTKTGKKWSTYVVDVEESSITTQGKNWVGDLIDKNTFNGFTVNQTYHIVLTFKYNKAETSIEIPVQRNDTGPDPDHWSSFVSFVKFTTPDKTLKAQDSSFDGTYQYDSMDTMYVSNHMSSSQIQTKKRSFFGLRSVRGVKTTDARTPDDDQFDMKVTDPSGNTVDGTTKTGKKWSTYVVDVEESSITTQGKNWVGDLIDKNTFNGFTVNQTYHIVLTFKYNKAETSIEIPVQRNDTGPDPDHWSSFVSFVKFTTPDKTLKAQDSSFDGTYQYDSMDTMYVSNHMSSSQIQTKKRSFFGLRSVRGVKTTDARTPDDDQFDMKVTDPSGNTVDGTTKTGKKWSTYVVDVEESSITTQGKNWVGDLIDKNTFNGFTVNQTYHIVLTFKYNKAETSIEIPVQRNDTGPDPDHWSSFVSFVKFTTPDKTLKAQDSSFDGTYQYDSMDTMYVSNHMSSSQIQTKKRSFFGLRSVRGVKTTDARTPDDDQFDMKVTDPSGNTVDGTTKTGKKWSTYVVDVEESSITTQGKNWVGDLIDKNTFNGFTVNQTYHIVLTFKYNKAETSIEIPVQRNDTGPDPLPWPPLDPTKFLTKIRIEDDHDGIVDYFVRSDGQLDKKCVSNYNCTSGTVKYISFTAPLYTWAVYAYPPASKEFPEANSRFSVYTYDDQNQPVTSKTGLSWQGGYIMFDANDVVEGNANWVLDNANIIPQADMGKLEIGRTYNVTIVITYQNKEQMMQIPIQRVNS